MPVFGWLTRGEWAQFSAYAVLARCLTVCKSVRAKLMTDSIKTARLSDHQWSKRICWLLGIQPLCLMQSLRLFVSMTVHATINYRLDRLHIKHSIFVDKLEYELIGGRLRNGAISTNEQRSWCVCLHVRLCKINGRGSVQERSINL